jgi:spermidine synthase
VATAFGHAATYRAFVPSFGTPWGFILARNVAIAPPDPAQIDARVERDLAGRCRWLDGASLLGARSLPPYVAEALDDPSIEPFCLADPPKYG